MLFPDNEFLCFLLSLRCWLEPKLSVGSPSPFIHWDLYSFCTRVFAKTVLRLEFSADQEGARQRPAQIWDKDVEMAVLRLTELLLSELKTRKVPCARAGCGFNTWSDSYTALNDCPLTTKLVGTNSCLLVFGNFWPYWKEQGTVQCGRFQNRWTFKPWEPLLQSQRRDLQRGRYTAKLSSSQSLDHRNGAELPNIVDISPLSRLKNFINLHVVTFCHRHSCWVPLSPDSQESSLCTSNMNYKNMSFERESSRLHLQNWQAGNTELHLNLRVSIIKELGAVTKVFWTYLHLGPWYSSLENSQNIRGRFLLVS